MPDLNPHEFRICTTILTIENGYNIQEAMTIVPRIGRDLDRLRKIINPAIKNSKT